MKAADTGSNRPNLCFVLLVTGVILALVLAPAPGCTCRDEMADLRDQQYRDQRLGNVPPTTKSAGQLEQETKDKDMDERGRTDFEGDEIRFTSVTGTGLAYHMDPIYKTPIRIDAVSSRALIGGKRSGGAGGRYHYEEMAGIQEEKSDDTVTFEGRFDRANGKLRGTYTYKRRAKTYGDDGTGMIHTVDLTGKLVAMVDEDAEGSSETVRTLKGRVVGTDARTTKEYGVQSPLAQKTSNPVAWTIVMSMTEREKDRQHKSDKPGY